jgi:predicted cupin superfamily sugar epimerase
VNKTEIIAALGLESHFEGGYFRAMFRATHRRSRRRMARACR